MKIDNSIRSAYAVNRELNELVKEEVTALRSQFDPKWHFESRIKSEESYALKIEAGLGTRNLEIDDFFACTVVVPNNRAVRQASDNAEVTFRVFNRRPSSFGSTKSRPTDFQFDDLRIYARLRPTFSGARPIDNVLFELQIKTFLQHAWGIATHDLTYKTDVVRWSKLRVASQIRAMLEHAELSIDQFENLAASDIISKEHSEFAEIDRLIDFIRSVWQPSALPEDLQRLARSARSAAASLGASVDQLIEYVSLETSSGRGAISLDLSPFGAMIQSVLARHKIDATRLPKGGPIMLSKAVQIPESAETLVGRKILIY